MVTVYIEVSYVFFSDSSISKSPSFWSGSEILYNGKNEYHRPRILLRLGRWYIISKDIQLYNPKRHPSIVVGRPHIYGYKLLLNPPRSPDNTFTLTFSEISALWVNFPSIVGVKFHSHGKWDHRRWWKWVFTIVPEDETIGISKDTL